ncbi:hypothetical protein [Paenibacillus sp. PL2-23]|uniref:hypothetical protein n=1 Tax=Paenibacillus sp. PL2-23 TaxID=2100729 RepID=UPI0030F4DDA0
MAQMEMLLQRLEDIGKVLERNGDALALLGLGSVGIETDRIDEYSDLDFFVIVSPGSKQRYIERLDWLEVICPIAYRFQNCEIGYKFLFEDGIYGEFAVFEEAELERAAYRNGRIVWKHPAYTNDELLVRDASSSPDKRATIDHAVGEALTNLYVGLGRYARGEKLSALKFIQSYPIDGLLSVMHIIEPEVDAYPDVFGNERRAERRFPAFASLLGTLLQGYDKIPESAVQLLHFLEAIHPINPRMRAEILALAEHCRHIRS